jgi:hypothetical protein
MVRRLLQMRLILASRAPRSAGSVTSRRPRPVLGGKTKGIAGAADEAANLTLGRLVPPAVGACPGPRSGIRLEQAHADDSIDDAGQLAAGLAALHLRLPLLAVEVVDDPLQDADEDHRLARRVLQVLQQSSRHSCFSSGVVLPGSAAS